MINLLRRQFVVLPIIFLFLTIFLFRSSVVWVYVAAITVVALTFIAVKGAKYSADKLLATWMIVLAALGLSAAVILSIEKTELLVSPNHVTSCSLSPVVSCSPVILSDQASAFGFPNPFIGIFGFACVLAAGMTLLAGASKLSKAWWRTLFGGIAFGAVFSSWLLYQGVFNIGKLCLYCMLVWLVTFALFWLTFSHVVRAKHVNVGKTVGKLANYPNEAIAYTYLAMFLIILIRWQDYWFSLF